MTYGDSNELLRRWPVSYDSTDKPPTLLPGIGGLFALETGDTGRLAPRREEHPDAKNLRAAL